MIIGVSNCGKTYLMNYILLQKQEQLFINTKSIYQYPNITAQTSDEFQSLENYENGSTIVFDNMLLSKQSIKIDLFFCRSRHQHIDIYYLSQSYFELPKKIFVIFNIIVSFEQTLRDTILLFHDIAG